MKLALLTAACAGIVLFWHWVALRSLSRRIREDEQRSNDYGQRATPPSQRVAQAAHVATVPPRASDVGGACSETRPGRAPDLKNKREQRRAA